MAVLVAQHLIKKNQDGNLRAAKIVLTVYKAKAYIANDGRIIAKSANTSSVDIVAPRGGIEPPACPLGGDRSIRLSYRGKLGIVT